MSGRIVWGFCGTIEEEVEDMNLLSKQAYLIMAHKDDFCFRTLLRLLDDPRNDIFIHMDKKNRSYDETTISEYIKKSKVYHVNRTNVTWGGYSMINAELLLLKKAVDVGSYQHYHLLSGQDLPIKTQDQIIAFFTKNGGKEFIQFEKEFYGCQDRTQYYNFLQEKIGRSRKPILRWINNYLIAVERKLHIERNKDVRFQKGANWFSITDGFARYVVEREAWIKKTFKQTICSDEIFLQTLLIASPYLDNLYHKAFDDDMHAIMRFIDWNRGGPYTFRRSDFDELCESEMLFARKFDAQVDADIIKSMLNKLLGESQ